MPLRIPKYVQVENFRLSVFYRATQVGIVVPLVLYFFFTEQHSKPLSLKEHVFIDTMVRGWQNPTLLAKVAAEKATEPWCKFPTDYNFVGDFLGHAQAAAEYDFRFQGHKCATVCSANNKAEGCLHPPDIWMEEGKNQFLLLTSLRDTTYHANGTSSAKAHLLPFAEMLGIAFKISYRELDKTVLRVGHTPRSVTGNVLSSAAFETATKFESSCGKAIRELAPGADLVLTVPEMFSLVCMDGYLDQIQASAGTNFENDAKNPNGALGRIVGAELTISVHVDADKRAAIVKATMSPVAYVGGSRSEAFVDNGETSLRFRQYNGIRIRFVADGIQTVFDINNVILNVSALVVYVSLPIIFIKFFAVYGLGHLSKIYKDVIYTKFSIAKECGAMATRLMGSSATFGTLQDVDDANGDGVTGDMGISRDKMKEHIREALSHRGTTIDDNEMQQFVELAFNEVDIDIIDHKGDTWFDVLKAAVRDYFDVDAMQPSSLMRTPSGNQRNINIDEFNSAFLAAFPISFDNVVKLFDKDRHQSPLEHVFMPSKLKNALSSAKVIEMMKRGPSDETVGRSEGSIDRELKATSSINTIHSSNTPPEPLRTFADPQKQIVEAPGLHVPSRNFSDPMKPVVQAPGMPVAPHSVITIENQEAAIYTSPASDFARPAEDEATSRLKLSFSNAQNGAGRPQVSTEKVYIASATDDLASAPLSVVVSAQNGRGLPPFPHAMEPPKVPSPKVSGGCVQMNTEVLNRLRLQQSGRVTSAARHRNDNERAVLGNEDDQS